MRISTAPLKNAGTSERSAMKPPNHAPTRTTQLYDWRPGQITLDNGERVLV